MIWNLMSVSLAGFAIGAVGMALANRRTPPPITRQRWLKLGVFFVIVHAVLGAAMLGTVAIQLLFIAIIGVCIVELARAWVRVPPPRPWRVWPVGVALAGAAAYSTLHNDRAILVWCFIVIACTDGFGQLVGQIFGRHALAPRVSPAKTLEGALGGIAAASVASLALRAEVALSVGAAVTWGAALAVAGLLGDLAASWLKRRAALKDYSHALPGQGGFLDRFDSLIGSLALLCAAWPGMT
jgi:phosphatidate cytidylyltransferase